MRLLIGFDGSDCARAAIRELSGAGLGDGGEARVVCVADVAVAVSPAVMVPQGGEGMGTWYTGLGDPREIRVKAEARADRTAAEGAALAADALPGWRVRSEAAIDAPYWGLIRAAEGWPADLILVGSHGRSALGRALLGSVSGFVLSHAPCSVRVARPRAGVRHVGGGADAGGAEAVRIVVGVDGSDGARAAVRAVCERGWPAGSEAQVVMAVDERLVTTFAAHAAWMVDRGPRLRGIQEALAADADELRAAGVRATSALLMGDPKRMLVEAARQWPADCIFLGAQGHSRLERFLLGSVSGAVAARAPCSVEVVR